MNICYSADFTTPLGQYHDLSPFRMWCQKVIPLVYDDSLSYYEVLCKLTMYINTLLENVETMEGNIAALHAAYVQLQNYVNTYFDNLDVQQEINNKLDEMASDGTLSGIISGFLNQLSGISYTKNRFQPTNTDYYITIIPKFNKRGKRNILRQYPANGSFSGSALKGRLYLRQTFSPFIMNAGLSDTNNTPYGKGFIMQDGEVLTNVFNNNSFDTIGTTPEGVLFTYNNQDTTIENLKADNIVDACMGYYTLIKDNNLVYPTDDSGWTDLYQRQVLCQLKNGDYLIFTCDGKNYRNMDAGMNYQQIWEILKLYNISIAYCMDGGGSTSTIINGELINLPTDTTFSEERELPFVWALEGYTLPDVAVENRILIGNNKERIQAIYARTMYNDTHYGNVCEVNNQVFASEATSFRKDFNWSDQENILSIRKSGLAYLISGNEMLRYDLNVGEDTYLLNGFRRFAPRTVAPVNTDIGVTDLNESTYSGVFYALSTCGNVPNSVCNWVVYQTYLNSKNTIFQAAIPINNNMDYKAMYRYSISDSWRDWRTFQ